MTKLEAQLLSDLLKQELEGKTFKDKIAETQTVIGTVYVHDIVTDSNGWRVYVLFPPEEEFGEEKPKRCELNSFYDSYSLIE